jgi:hypothetical protein
MKWALLRQAALAVAPASKGSCQWVSMYCLPRANFFFPSVYVFFIDKNGGKVFYCTIGVLPKENM